MNECNAKISLLWGNEGAPPLISINPCIDSFVDQSLSTTGLNVVVKPPEGSFVSPSDYTSSLRKKVFYQLQKDVKLYDKEAKKWKDEGVFQS